MKFIYNKIINNSENKRIAHGIFWSVFGEILSKAFVFLSYIFVARILGREYYGQFGILRTTIMMFALFGGLGLGLTANKFLSEFRENKKYCGEIIGLTTSVSFLSGLLFASLVFFFAQYISDVLRAPLINEIRISALILLLSAINGSQIGILQGFESYKKLAFASIIQGLTSLPLFICFSYFAGVLGAITAFAINIGIYTIILQVLINREVKKEQITFEYKFKKSILNLFWRFSLPAALTGIAISPVKWYCETLLVKNTGFNQLGIFQAAIVITTVIGAICSTLNAPLITISSNLQKSNNKNRIKYFTIYGSWFLFIICSLPFLLFPKLIILIFGEKFNDPLLYKTSLLLILYCGMLMYYQGIMRIIILNNSLWFAFFTNIIEGIVLLLSFIFLIKFGVIGLCYAYVLSYLARIIISLPFIYRYNIIEKNIIFDKYFIVSFVVILILIFSKFI